MDIRCPNCGEPFAAPDEIAGRKARCGACKTVFVVPRAAEAVRPCPACGAALAAGAILCASCGLNLETGLAGRSHWGDEHEVVEDEDFLSLPVRFMVFFGEWVPGLFRPKVLIFSLLCMAAGIVLLWLCVFVTTLGAVLGGLPIGAFGLICYAQAIAMVLCGDVVLLSDALAELNGTKWALFIVILFAPLLTVLQAIRGTIMS